MKSSRSFRAISRATVLAIPLSVLALTVNAQAQGRPDLRVSAVNTPGGLCQGNTNKIQATIQNSSQLAAVSSTVPVWLRVKNQQFGIDDIYESTAKPIGPNGSQPAWFHNVKLIKTGTYQFIVTADPGNNIVEAAETNNTMTITRTVQTICGQAPPPTQYTLTIKVYEHGTWLGGQGQWIPGASVTLTKKYDASFPPQTQTTNSSGQVSFQVQGGQTYEFKALKSGCSLVPSSGSGAGSNGVYGMGNYNATRYLALDCQ